MRIPIIVTVAILFSGSDVMAPNGIPPLRHGPLIFGESRKEDVERFLGEPLRCSVTRTNTSSDTVIEVCEPARQPTVRYPIVIIVDGVLRSLRYQLASNLDVDSAVRGIERTYGPVRSESFGQEGTSDLRIWEFAADPYIVVLSEAKHRRTGEIALRLLLSDRSGGWYPGGQH